MQIQRTCTVPNCQRPYSARSLCKRHYLAAWKVNVLPPTATIADRFAWKCVPNANGCVEWIGANQKNGYGHLTFGGRTELAHRVAWLTQRGPIPDGLVIDHLCRNPKCVNVEHLRVVTRQVNTLAGETLGSANAAKTHCLRGHEFTEANTARSKGKRYCRECRRIRHHA